jgi:hypothetical protein
MGYGRLGNSYVIEDEIQISLSDDEKKKPVTREEQVAVLNVQLKTNQKMFELLRHTNEVAHSAKLIAQFALTLALLTAMGLWLKNMGGK